MAGLAIAVTPRRFDQASRQWVDGSPTYVDLSVWGEQAEHVADSLRKGDRIVVLGRWTTRTYTVGGEEWRKLEVTVDEIGPSLRWATALPTKATAKSAAQAGNDEPPFGWGMPATRRTTRRPAQPHRSLPADLAVAVPASGLVLP